MTLKKFHKLIFCIVLAFSLCSTLAAALRPTTHGDNFDQLGIRNQLSSVLKKQREPRTESTIAYVKKSISYPEKIYLIGL